MNNWTLVLFLIIIFSSCEESSFGVVDYYRVYPEDEFGEGFYLVCKLGCDNDAKIENIRSIKWNQEEIYIEQELAGSINWFIIRASGNSLKCCSNDNLIGPIGEEVLLLYLDNINNLKERRFY